MRALIIASLLLCAAATHAQPPASCTLAADDRAWIDDLLVMWRGVAREELRVEPEPLPLMLFFDRQCAWTRDGDSLTGSPHGGTLTMPDGATAPVRLMSFVGSFGPGEQPYLVMAMPAIWAVERKDATSLPLLMRAVFAHEMAHTVQAKGIGQWFAEIEKQTRIPDDLDDDIIQTRFEKNAEFARMFSEERDQLYVAANELAQGGQGARSSRVGPDASRQREAVARAVAMMRARRARFFTGADAPMAMFEDLFLSMEGLGNWTAYRVARRAGLSPVEAQAFIRRGRPRWSQDEGLAAFMIIDALVPDWRPTVLSGRPTSVLDLLDAARK
jgi:hypothetical protein